MYLCQLSDSPDIRRKEECVPVLKHGKYADSILQVEANAITCVCKTDVWRRMCDLVFLVGAHVVDSWAHDYVSTRLHSLQEQQWQNPRLMEGWSCTDSTCIRAILFSGFYDNCFLLLLIPYPFHHGSCVLLSKSEHATIGY